MSSSPNSDASTASPANSKYHNGSLCAAICGIWGATAIADGYKAKKFAAALPHMDTEAMRDLFRLPLRRSPYAYAVYATVGTLFFWPTPDDGSNAILNFNLTLPNANVKHTSVDRI
jgi:hypothetical protein